MSIEFSLYHKVVLVLCKVAWGDPWVITVVQESAHKTLHSTRMTLLYHTKFLSKSIGLIKHLLPLSWSSLSEICQFIIWLWLELIGHGFRSILQYRDQRRRPYSDGFLSTTGRDYIAVVLRLLTLWAEFLYFSKKIFCITNLTQTSNINTMFSPKIESFVASWVLWSLEF